MPILEKNLQIREGQFALADTIIQFESPIRVKYHTFNKEVFEGEFGVELEGTGEYSTDPRMNGAELFEIEVNASSIAISTKDYSRGGTIDIDNDSSYRTDATRIVEHELPTYLREKPMWAIQDSPDVVMNRESKTLEDALNTHNSLVEGVMSHFKEHNPRVIYEGPFLYQRRQ